MAICCTALLDERMVDRMKGNVERNRTRMLKQYEYLFTENRANINQRLRERYKCGKYNYSRSLLLFVMKPRKSVSRLMLPLTLPRFSPPKTIALMKTILGEEPEEPHADKRVHRKSKTKFRVTCTLCVGKFKQARKNSPTGNEFDGHVNNLNWNRSGI